MTIQSFDQPDQFLTSGLQAPSSARMVGIVEGAVLIGGIFFLERIALFDMNALPLHPLTFVVALLAVQYGAFGGVAAAIGALIASFLGGSLPTRVIGENYFDYLAAAWSAPLVWLIVAILLGIVSDNNRRALDKARTEIEALRHERDVITAQYGVLAERARRLERVAIGLDRHGVKNERSHLTI